MSNRPRIVVALPDRAECAVLAEWLTAEGYEPITRFTVPIAEEEMHAHRFDLLVADALFVFRDGLRPGKAVSNTGTPVVVVGNGEQSLEDTSGQAMYLRRPVDRTIFVCYITMAILEGRPTRCSVRKPVNRLDAFVNGVPVRLLDVSNEGLRVAMSAGRSTPLPVYFNVHIPFLGVSVTAQRKWSRLAGANAAETWYGGALSQNRSTAEHAWRKFVDTIPSLS